MRPPSPRFRFPGAHLLGVIRRPLAFYRQMGEECGDAAYFRVGPQRLCLVNHAEYIKQVLATQARKLVKAPAYKMLKPIMGEGLVTSEGKLHLRQRRLCQPAFHWQRMPPYARIMTDCAARLAAEWRAGAVIDPYREMSRVSLRITGLTLFGTDLSSDVDPALHATERLLQHWNISRAPLIVLLDRFGLSYPGARALRAARQGLDEVVYRAIDKRRRAAAPGDDLLSHLVHAVDEDGDGEGMTDEQLRDEAVTFLLAGFETVASVLTWIWCELAQNADLAERLDQELQETLQGRTPEMADLPKLDLTRRLFAEAMRLYPPVWIMGRKAIEEVELGPYTLPRGCLVVASPYVTHRRADYFPEPDRFDPDRWLPDRQAHLPEMAYFPFGGGVRRCIGERYAQIEGPLVLATLAQHWRMELASAPPRETTKALFLRPEPGLRLKLHRRTSWTVTTGPSLRSTRRSLAENC